MLESSLEEFFRTRVRLLGGYVIKMAPTELGIPDRLVFFRGEMYLVELKADAGELSPIQRHWHSKIAGHGITVHVVRGRAGVVRWLKERVDALGPQDTETDELSQA